MCLFVNYVASLNTSLSYFLISFSMKFRTYITIEYISFVVFLMRKWTSQYAIMLYKIYCDIILKEKYKLKVWYLLHFASIWIRINNFCIVY